MHRLTNTLLATLLTTSLVGSRMWRDFQANLPPLGVEELWDAFVHGWSQPLALLGGLPFSLTLLTILMAHEMAGDLIEFELPIKPQRVKASEKVAADRGLVALRFGPLVYNFEAADNAGMDRSTLPALSSNSPLNAKWEPDLLDGVVVIRGQAPDGSPLTAIPNYARNNRTGRSAVWIRDGGSESAAGHSQPSP